MTDTSIDQLVAAIRALAAADQLCVARRVIEALPIKDRLLLGEDAVAPATTSRPAGAASTMLGLFADEPDLVDEVCAHIYAERGR